jgi:light-regulated signal transduction histidine kinase (bacteriophytochrome)
VPVTRNADEIAILIEAFNEMLEQIQKRDTALQAARDELELRVERRTAQLEAVNRELESFTYSVAHDLRAPLRHIQGFADALTEDFAEQLDPGARQHLDRIVESTRRMDQLISDLLNLAHVGRQELRLQAAGLDLLVQDVERDMALESKGRNIEWRLGELPVVDCDPALIKLVLQNLLANAVKYTRPRDPAVIEIGQTIMDGERVIFVRDNGVGFNMKYVHKLFGVFERLHRREDFEGTGVGLAIVQRIIHKHGGRIWAEAEINRGATFFFTLTTPGQRDRSESPASRQ